MVTSAIGSTVPAIEIRPSVSGGETSIRLTSIGSTSLARPKQSASSSQRMSPAWYGLHGTCSSASNCDWQVPVSAQQ